MKESKLIEMQNRIAKIGEVLNEILRKLQQIDTMAKGTLTAFQLYIGEDKWKELGPLNLYELFDDGKIEVDHQLQIKQIQNIKFNESIFVSKYGQLNAHE